MRVLSTAARAALIASRAYIRYTPMHPGKRWLWEKVFLPHLGWRGNHGIARTRWGGELAFDTRDLIQRCIYHYGVWEPTITELIASRLKPGDCFIDVGANIGYYSVLASKLVGASGSVVAIEPFESTLALLRANLARNHVTNARVIPQAASRAQGELAMLAGASGNIGGTSTVDADAFPDLPKVKGVPLCEALSPAELSRARLIKIDTEGGELDVLEGLAPALPQLPARCEILVEVSPKRLADRGQSAAALYDLLTAHGFRGYAIENAYELDRYLELRPSKPKALDAVPTVEGDVLFSRAPD